MVARALPLSLHSRLEVKSAALPLSLGGLSLAGFLALLFATDRGVGTSPDSVLYVTVARQLASGAGFTFIGPNGELTGLTHYPPLYPILLWLISLPGVDPFAGARWLQALLFAANIVLVAWIIHRSTEGSLFAAALGGFLVLVSVDMLAIHAMAWTEGLFLCLSLLALLLFAEHCDRPKARTLIACAVVASLALFTKYPAVALILTVVLARLVWPRAVGPLKYRDAAIFTLISTLPTILWMVRNALVSGNPAGRIPLLHPPSLEHLKSALGTMARWLTPAEGLKSESATLVSLAGAAILAIGLLAVGWWAVRARRRLLQEWRTAPQADQRARLLPRLLMTFAALYLAALVTSLVTLDASMPFDLRKLSPVYLAMVPVVVHLGWLVARRVHRLYDPAIAAGLLGLLVLSYAVRAGHWLGESHANGLGYSSKAWQDSDTMRRIRDLPESVLVYANHPAAVYVNANRQAVLVPMKLNPVTRLPNAGYAGEMSTILKRLRDGSAVVVYFSEETWPFVLSENELISELPVSPLATESDGLIYGVDRARG